MGFYISATEIAAMLPERNRGVPLITATSTPINLSELDSFIIETEAEVESAVSIAGYIVPVSTTATGFQQVRAIVRRGAAFAALQEIFPGEKENDSTALASTYRAAYDRAIAQLVAGKLPILGAERDPGETTRLRPAGRGNPSPVITSCWRP